MSQFQWGEYIDLAELMLGTPLEVSDEAHWRVAISRAYYGAFCTARNILRSEGISLPTDARAHGRVVHELNRARDQQRKRIGSELKRLRQRRNAADYDDVVSPRFRKRSKAAVKTARRVVDVMLDDDSEE